MRIIITEDQYKRIIKEDINNQDKILKTINRIGLLKTIETIGYDTFKKMIPVDIIDRDKKIELINYICNYEDDAIYFYDIMYHDIVISEESVEDGISIESIYSIENNYVNAKTTTYNEDGEIVAEPYGRGYLIPINKLENNIIDIIFESLVKYYFNITRIDEGLITEVENGKDKDVIDFVNVIGLRGNKEPLGSLKDELNNFNSKHGNDLKMGEIMDVMMRKDFPVKINLFGYKVGDIQNVISKIDYEINPNITFTITRNPLWDKTMPGLKIKF